MRTYCGQYDIEAGHGGSSRFALVSLSPGSLTFSAGGALYKQTATSADDISGVSGWSCGSITFVATSTTGSVSFTDASMMDVVPSYGPYLDNVSLDARYIIADIDVDSNNDGSIDKFDDPIEMASRGMFVIPGSSFSAQARVLSNQTLNSTLFGARIVSSNSTVAASQELNLLTGSDLTYQIPATANGSATITYEIYYKPTGSVVASDSVLVTVGKVIGVDASKTIVEENEDSSIISFYLSSPSTDTITINYTLGGNAKYKNIASTSNYDYDLHVSQGVTFTAGSSNTIATGTVTFQPGETSHSITLTTFDDIFVERLYENVTFALASVSTENCLYVIDTNRQSIDINIKDNDTLDLQSVTFGGGNHYISPDPGENATWNRGSNHWEKGKILGVYAPVAYDSSNRASVTEAHWTGELDSTDKNNLGSSGNLVHEQR